MMERRKIFMFQKPGKFLKQKYKKKTKYSSTPYKYTQILKGKTSMHCNIAMHRHKCIGRNVWSEKFISFRMNSTCHFSWT
jgi:hypothetical protein